MAKDEITKVKKLEEYNHNKPLQFSLFEVLDLTLEDENGKTARHYKLAKYGVVPSTRSHTIELYDFMPKYFWGEIEQKEDGRLDTLKREFEYRKTTYKISVYPARIEDKEGAEKEQYPGQREELVEDALRKLACEGNGLFLDDSAGVSFTLYQLQKELGETGHTYSYDELKEALMVCNGTRLKITTADGKAVFSAAMFETVGMRTFEEWKEKGKQTRCFVRFNSLVTKSIKDRTYRLLNYDKAMRYKSRIARLLHKRLSHLFTYASPSKQSYNIKLSTLIRDFGLKAYSRLRDNLREVKKALDEMKKKDVIYEYRIEKMLDANERNKLVDATIYIIASRSFWTEMLDANDWHKDRKEMEAEINNPSIYQKPILRSLPPQKEKRK